MLTSLLFLVVSVVASTELAFPPSILDLLCKLDQLRSAARIYLYQFSIPADNLASRAELEDTPLCREAYRLESLHHTGTDLHFSHLVSVLENDLGDIILMPVGRPVSALLASLKRRLTWGWRFSVHPGATAEIDALESFMSSHLDPGFASDAETILLLLPSFFLALESLELARLMGESRVSSSDISRYYLEFLENIPGNIDTHTRGVVEDFVRFLSTPRAANNAVAEAAPPGPQDLLREKGDARATQTPERKGDTADVLLISGQEPEASTCTDASASAEPQSVPSRKARAPVEESCADQNISKKQQYGGTEEVQPEQKNSKTSQPNTTFLVVAVILCVSLLLATAGLLMKAKKLLQYPFLSSLYLAELNCAFITVHLLSFESKLSTAPKIPSPRYGRPS